MKFYNMPISVLIALASANTACSSTIEGNGSIEKLNRKTIEFTEIEVSGSIHFNYIKSNQSSCEVEADSNLVDNIKTEVNGKTLKVYADNSYTTRHRVVVNCSSNSIDSAILTGSGVFKANDLKVEYLNLIISGSGSIYANQLKVDSLNLAISGSGSIYANQLKVDNLNLGVAGSGDILVSGNADVVNANVSGSGDVQAKKLNANNSNLVVSGSGKVYHSTSNRVTASVVGSGDILIFGEPKSINRSVVGSGSIKVIKL